VNEIAQPFLLLLFTGMGDSVDKGETNDA